MTLGATVGFYDSAAFCSALRPLDSDQKVMLPRTQFGMRQGGPATIISEAGLRKVVMRSDMPVSKSLDVRLRHSHKIQNWLHAR